MNSLARASPPPNHQNQQEPSSYNPQPERPLSATSSSSSSANVRSQSQTQSRYQPQQAYPSHQYQQQAQQQPLDEAFRFQRQSHSTDTSTYPTSRSLSQPPPAQHQQHQSSQNQDVKSLYHLPSEPFDSSFSLAGLKSSPISDLSPSGRVLAPGPSAQNFSQATEAFKNTQSQQGQVQGRGQGQTSLSIPGGRPGPNPQAQLQNQSSISTMTLDQTQRSSISSNAGTANPLDPSSYAFNPMNQQHGRKPSYAIPIVSPGLNGGAGVGAGSPVGSRNSSLSSDVSERDRDPEEIDGANEDGDEGGKEDKVVYKSPVKRQPHPITISSSNNPTETDGPGSRSQTLMPGTPPRSASFSVPSIQTIAATPVKARYPSGGPLGGHRRADSFVGPDESVDNGVGTGYDQFNAYHNGSINGNGNGSPRKTRLSLGGSSSSLRQSFTAGSMSIPSLSKKSSYSTIGGGDDREKHDGKRTLWFGDLEPWMDDNYMRSVTGMCGWDVDNIKLIRPTTVGGVPDVSSPIMNAGYCFITFATQEEALRVLTIITPSATNAPVPMPNSTRNFRANWASGATVANPFTTPTALPPTDGKEYSVFVGDLAPTVTEEILIQTFMHPPEMADGGRIEGFAGVRGAKIMTDPVTGLSKMYGFVRLSNEEEQQRALVEMQGVPCLARAMRISPATTRARTASGAVEPLPSNIARAVTPDYLLPGKPSGQGNSPSVPATGLPRVPSPAPTSSIHRPIPTTLAASLSNPFAQTYPSAILSGASPGEIAIAADPALALNLAQIKVLARTPLGPLPNGPNVHHSVAFNDPTNSTVFVGGLSPLVTEDMLRAFFAPFGEISKVTVPPGKKCGFVHFVAKADAENSIEKLQGFPLAGNQLRLSWGKSSTPSTKLPSFSSQSSYQNVTPVAAPVIAPVQPNPLQAQILQMQQQLAALTAIANSQNGGSGMVSNGAGYASMLPAMPGLSPSSNTSFSPISPPSSAASDALTTLARTDPQLFAQLVASNPVAFAGALRGSIPAQPQMAPQLYDGSFVAQLQANQQQMLQLQAMQAQLEEPHFGGLSPYSQNQNMDTSSRQYEQGQFWTAKNPPAIGRSVSPFSQTAQAMAERASERNSGRSRHSTSPGEHVSYLSAQAPQHGSDDSRRGSAAPRYVPPGQGGLNGDFAGQFRSRTKSESVNQAFGGLSVSNAGQRQASFSGGQSGSRVASYTDLAGRANSESPRALRRMGGSFTGA